MSSHQVATRSFLALIVTIAVTAPAFGQLDRFNRDKLIEGLQKRGMGEMLVHLAQTEKFEDPTDAARIEVEQLRIRANDHERFDLETRIAACEQAMDKLRSLIHDPKLESHPKRPMWQTDLSEIILFTYLRTLKLSANEFFEFGVPSAEQHQAFVKGIQEAVIELSLAERGFFRLRSDLPKQPDFNEKFELTGLWDRMINEYDKKRTKFFLAHAAYYASLLPAQSKYYTSLGKQPAMPRQKATVREERVRLCKVAMDALAAFIDDKSDPNKVRMQSLSIQGRCQMQIGQLPKAIASLDEVVKANKQDFNDFISSMALARANGKDGKMSRANRMIQALEGSDIARGNDLYLLLLTDLRHRILLDAAGKDVRKIGKSFTPYEDFMKNKPDLKGYIHKRWERRVTNAKNPSALPGMMLVGVSELMLGQGRNLMIESDEVEASNAALAESKRNEGMPKLNKAKELLGILAKREDELDSVRAKAMWNLGIATYFQDRQDLAKLIEAINIWIDLGDLLPKESDAKTAMQNAVGFLRQLLTDDPKLRKHLMPVYKRAFDVLQSKFPDDPMTDNERAYFVYEVVLKKGDYAEAIKIFKRVPQGHVTYFDSQRGIVDCEFELYKRRRAEKKDTRIIELLTEVKRVRREAELALEAAEPDKPLGPLYASAVSRLIESQLAVDRADPAAAVSALDGFEKDFSEHTDLIQEALEQRIIALSTLGKADEANTAATRMFNEFPDAAGAVVDNVLRDMIVQVEQLREDFELLKIASDRQAVLRKIRNLSKTGELLANQLIAWATEEGLAEDEMLTYRMIQVQSMIMVGKSSEAAQMLATIAEKYPGDANVLFTQAEALYKAGLVKTDAAAKTTDLRAAAKIYYQLIDGLDPAKNADAAANEKMLGIWWQAWLRALQIADVRQKGADQIPDRVEVLRGYDDNLGGTILRQRFLRLAAKYN